MRRAHPAAASEGGACLCGGSRPSHQKARGDYGRVMRTKEDVANDRLLAAFLVASVAVVLVGWATALVYLGFHIF